MRRSAITATALVIGIAAGWVLLLPSRPAAQPIAFNHARHQALTCVVCHAGVERAAGATLPQIATCAKCHATAPATVAQGRWDSMMKAGRIDWVRVTRVPAHVMFSHRRHVVLARLDCTSCHGDTGAATTPPPRAARRLEMAACLSCHQQGAASQDCAACHR